MIVKTDCQFFRGDIPCLPHKAHSYHCDDCPEYSAIEQQILIIKLGAIGDVIRTTPLITKLQNEHPNAYITWLTYTPEILPKSKINRILQPSIENLELIKNINFDWLINLDKDPLAISLTKSLTAKRKTGFTIDKFGHAIPIQSEAEHHKWLTGLFDDLNKENTKHYVEEIFDICGYKFEDQEYILDINSNCDFDLNDNKNIIGLNTGCGGRWTSRLWPKEYWIELAKGLIEQGYETVLLGGAQEHEANLTIARESGAKYLGHFPLNDFIALVNKCSTIVTAVTMGMHIAIALKKKLVLFNNIFNKNEFHLYDRGIILEPEFDCDCYFSPTCKNNCMQYLYPEKVLESVNALNNPS